MGFRTSYSQNNTYINCPKYWHMNYIEKWEGSIEGASLYYGSAMDAAVTAMLEKKTDWLDIFYDKWNRAYSFGTATQVFDNPNIVFSNKDFDEYVLEPADMAILQGWAAKLGVTSDPVDLYKDISSRKKNPYKTVSTDELQYFNRASWLSMKKKGKLLLEAFHTDFYPKIKKVVSTQQRGSITDNNTGDSIVGYIDMVLEIDGYSKPIIFDLKTAAQPYKQEDIDLTQQLTLYSAMKGADYNTNLVGYVVLCKNIPKEDVSFCSKCNYKKNGRHKTCDNILTDGSRCNGSWVDTKICKPEIQVLVQEKSQTQIDDLLLDIGNIILAMKNNVVYKNTSKCNNWYGSRCAFYDACYSGDTSKLKRKK